MFLFFYRIVAFDLLTINWSVLNCKNLLEVKLCIPFDFLSARTHHPLEEVVLYLDALGHLDQLLVVGMIVMLAIRSDP